MLNNLDLNTLSNTLDILDLKDYKFDGTLSYCDITDLSTMINNTRTLIDKVIIAKQKNNQVAMSTILGYPDNDLVRVAAAEFYDKRDLFSTVFYYVDEMKKQQVYYIPDGSIIPPKLPITKSKVFTKLDISDLYAKNNTDLDMLADKMLMVMFKYFHTGQILMNDMDLLTYSYALMSAISSEEERKIYDCIKNITFLISTFVVVDRLLQLKEAVKYFNDKKEYYIAENTSYSSSWILEPRKGNMEALTKLLEDVEERDKNRVILLINRHNLYLAKIKELNVSA